MTTNKLLLPDIDLNLLVALHTLLETAHVTRAAERLGVSQSAMSHTLRRLREIFGDPLLVRSRGGMVPTRRAEEIRGPLLNGLLNLESLVRQNKDFDPSTSSEKFSIGATEFMQLLFLPQLVDLLSQEAPAVGLHVFTPEARQSFRLLESGDIDFFIGSVVVRSMAEQVPGLMQRELGREPMVCAVRNGHPQVSGHLSLEVYANLPHILISPTGKGPGLVDMQLQRYGYSRHISVRLSSFLMAPWVTANSDYILTAPRRVIESLQDKLALQVLEPPLEIASVPVILYWHERKHMDPTRQWMRQAIIRAYETKTSPEPPAPPQAKTRRRTGNGK